MLWKLRTPEPDERGEKDDRRCDGDDDLSAAGDANSYNI